MKLFFRQLGAGYPLVILHGLYGSSDNWISVGRALSDKYEVFLIDQRNHGQSPHSPSHTYEDLSQDLLQFLDDHNLEQPIIVGHSMGGKVAMQFASTYPHRVKGLVVVDILPSSYRKDLGVGLEQENQHAKILSSLLMLPIGSATSRDDLDTAFAQNIKDDRVRQFLLKSVKRSHTGGFQWQLNVEGLSQNLPALMNSVLPEGGQQPLHVPTLFLRGEKSPYVHTEGVKKISSWFENYQIKTIANAGHWVHAENPQDLMAELNRFANKLLG